MDEFEFQRILSLFPVVRSRDYRLEPESSRQSTSQTQQNEELKEWQDAWNQEGSKEIEILGDSRHDAFWENLKLAARKKVGAVEAEEFVKSFQRIYEKLVFEELSLDAAQRFLSSCKVSK